MYMYVASHACGEHVRELDVVYYFYSFPSIDCMEAGTATTPS